MSELEVGPGPSETPDGDIEEFLVAGRPIEDRGFEAVEVGVGASLGLAIGTAVAGPIGAAAGVIAGAAAGLVAGEVIERVAGRAAETTDATRPRVHHA